LVFFWGSRFSSREKRRPFFFLDSFFSLDFAFKKYSSVIFCIRAHQNRFFYIRYDDHHHHHHRGGGDDDDDDEEHRAPRETFTGAEQRGAQALDPVSDSRSEIEMSWKNVRFSRPRTDENDRRGREEDGGKRRRRKSGDAEKR
jgi:hypothetical protein